MRTSRALISAILLLSLSLLASCATLIEKTGTVLDRSAFAEKEIARYRREAKKGDAITLVSRKDGTQALVILPESHPALKLYGTAPGPEGKFFLTHYTFLASNRKGWNEFTVDLFGTGVFTIDGGQGVLHLEPGMEALDLSSGKTRRGDIRLTGEQALTALRNRRERILALTQWMQEQPGAPAFENQKDFAAFWEEPALRTAVLPEELQTLRDSGTLLLDWEEGLSWIYLEYCWNTLVESLEQKQWLTKIK
jgi:hypothetical protein